MLGRVLCERYELEEKIGSGGMAEVYRAHDKLLDRAVAVKILHEAYRSDAEFVEKFQAARQLRLVNKKICSIFPVTKGVNFMLGRVLCERYELEEKIGSGGMAEVYRAHDKLLDRAVAVKILHEAYRSDAEFVEKFQAARQLRLVNKKSAAFFLLQKG